MHWHGYTFLTHPSPPGLWSGSHRAGLHRPGWVLGPRQSAGDARQGTRGPERAQRPLGGKGSQEGGYCYRTDRQSPAWK